MAISVVSTIAPYAVGALGIATKAVLANPIITVVSLAILTSDKWLPQAKAGPLAFMACYASCMAASNAQTMGAFLPATQIFCQNLCAPLLAAPCP